MTTAQTTPTPDEILSSLAGEEDVLACATRWCGADLGSLSLALESAAETLHRGAMRDVAHATRSALRLVALSDAVGDHAGRLASRLASGISQSYGNAFETALATFAEADALGERFDDRASENQRRSRILLARIGLARVHALARLGRLDDAAASGEAAIVSLESMGASELAARGHANLGVLERMRQRPERAIERFRAALATWGADPVARAQLTSNLAEALLDLDRFVEAEQAFRTSLAALEAANVTHAAAIVEGNLADLLSRQGRLSEALEHYERVRRRYLSIDARGDAARLQAEEADAFARTGLIGEAVAEYHGALVELERCGLRLEAFRARLGLARALGRLARFDEAARVLEVLDLTKDQPGAAVGPIHDGVLHTVQGELALATGDALRAQSELSKAIPLLVSRPTEQAVARARLATARRELGEVSSARALIGESLEVARSHLLRPLEADLLHELARCARSDGDEEAAMSALRSSVDTLERVRGTLQASRLRSAFVAENTSAASELLLALVRRGDPNSLREALRVSEGVRSRGLLDAIAGAVPIDVNIEGDSEGGAESGDLLREAATIRHEANVLFSRLDRQPEVAKNEEWRQAVLSIESRQRLVESRLGARERLRGSVASTPSHEEIERVIASPTAHLVTCVAGSRLVAIVTVGGTIQGADLGEAVEIAERVERFRFQVHRSLMSAGARAKRIEQDLLAALGAIADLVVAPFADLLTSAHAVQVVPAGPLHAVPLGLLPIGRDALIASRPVVSVPSIGLELALATHTRRGRATGGRVVVGVADAAAPSIATEAKAIAGLVGTERLLLGEEATCQRVREASQHAAILHCASHGRFVAESPLRSGIRLGDGWVTVTDLFRWHIPRTIVVVSGCDTGRVAVEGGDELSGLQRGFFAAGASGLVLSAWLAHDEATLDLMLSFHQRLGTPERLGGTDASCGSALRDAMMETRRERPRLVEWGAFSAYGRVDA
jgi:tetratricopeptide (TPR) repeat protein